MKKDYITLHHLLRQQQRMIVAITLTKTTITLPPFSNRVKETRLHLCKFDAERAIPSSFTINTYNLSRMLKIKSKQNKSLSTSTVERFSFISDNSSGLRTLRIKYWIFGT